MKSFKVITYVILKCIMAPEMIIVSYICNLSPQKNQYMYLQDFL